MFFDGKTKSIFTALRFALFVTWCSSRQKIGLLVLDTIQFEGQITIQCCFPEIVTVGEETDVLGSQRTPRAVAIVSISRTVSVCFTFVSEWKGTIARVVRRIDIIGIELSPVIRRERRRTAQTNEKCDDNARIHLRIGNGRNSTKIDVIL